MIAANLANVEENTIYNITVNVGGDLVKMQGTFDFVSESEGLVGFSPRSNSAIMMVFDMDSVESVDGAEGDNKGD